LSPWATTTSSIPHLPRPETKRAFLTRFGGFLFCLALTGKILPVRILILHIE
jgi:hypothetical protein